jgi:UDP-glucuronate 4-epimerase
LKILVTGAAGFIGAAVSKQLLERGDHVFGIDSINAYYSPELKQTRLAELAIFPNFTFHQQDLSEIDTSLALIADINPDVIIHLAAQAGVRASAEVPFDYVKSNLIGHMTVLEASRRLPNLVQLVYASSSSVYGNRSAGKFCETDRVDSPTSLYAATKRADELMSQVYCSSYGVRATGLRFFTVYGPAGRPDMAYFTFAENIIAGKPITVFDDGVLTRDFTFIDDIVSGVITVADHPPEAGIHRIYNIGNDEPQSVLSLVAALEAALGRKAIIQTAPKPPYDVDMTAANIDAMRADFGWSPTTSLEAGIMEFGAWFLAWKENCKLDDLWRATEL